MKLWICLFVFTFFASSTHAQDKVFLHDLTSAKVLSSNKVFTQKTLAIFFKPNCSACLRLLSQLQCIEDKYKIVLLGFEASEKDLLREFLKLELNYPAFKAPLTLMSQWKLSPRESPQFVLTNKKSEKLVSGKGYMACKDLEALIRPNT